MTLGRFFTLITAMVCGVIILSGITNYWIANSANRQVQRDDAKAIAKGVAANIHWQVQDLKRAIEFIAAREDLILLMEEGDSSKLTAESDRLSSVLQGGLRVRLLKNTIIEPDKSVQPHMGYADLQMVHEAAEKSPAPMVHEFKTQNKHLAIARPIVSGEQVVGVILASISTDVLTQPISVIPIQGRIELKQGPLRLGASGTDMSGIVPDGTVPILGTSWVVNYWLPPQSGLSSFFLIILTLITAILAGIAVMLGNRWLRNAFVNDLDVIVTVARGLLVGKVQGNYPVKIKDFEYLVGKLVKLKRETGIKVKIPDTGPSVIDEMEEEELAVPESSLLSPDNSEELGIESAVPSTIFRAYDIRGIVDETLTDKVVGLIGQAVGSEARDCAQETVIIAHDGRLSSPRLSAALAKGLQSTGCNVIDIGMVPTPLLYFATHFLDSKSGVMVTGSHNPSNYNGLKMVINGETLSSQRIQQLRHRIEAEDFLKGEGTLETRDLVPDYVGTIIEDVQVGSPLKVVVDCGNGVAGKLAPVLLRTLGCEVVELFCDIDGSFPNHHPDPGKPENMQDLIAKVKEEEADLGVAFDGDGDRLGVVDSSGKIIWPDRQMMLFSADVLSRQPGADIIFDVKCSRNLSREIVKMGGRPLMWKTGHSLIKAKIKETNAALAGEMSGHIFFSERWFGFDDGLYSASRLIEIISADTRSSSEIFQELPDSVNTPELNISLEEGENFRFVKDLLDSNQFADAKITDIDGLRADYSEGWGLVRASNTTPSLVIRFEADNQEALETIQERFRVAMTQVKTDIQLPF